MGKWWGTNVLERSLKFLLRIISIAGRNCRLPEYRHKPRNKLRGGRDGRYLVRAFACFIFALVGACATTEPLETQTKALDRGQARIYFLRESTLLYAAAAPDVMVNGQPVGRVGNASYFFVDRPPGTYKVTLEVPLSPGRYAADVTLRPGRVYYLKIAPRVENYLTTVAAGLVGQLIEASVLENSGGYSLTPLDEQAGQQMLRELTK
jgi:hypothetical protein